MSSLEKIPETNGLQVSSLVKEKDEHSMENGSKDKTSSDDEEEDDGGMQITYPPTQTVDRATWGGKLEFVLSCVSYAVGLGNVWRFPFLCHKNGGGAFLLPYVIMLFLVGLPLFFLEFAFGQFASLGPISIWNVSPLFKGIGYAMVTVSWILSLYYNVIVAESLLFLFHSFARELPWTNCDNLWNNMSTCIDLKTNLSNLPPRLFNSTLVPNFTYTSPAEDFYYNKILQKSGGIDEMGMPSWELSLCLLLAWIITALVLIKGVQSLGKAAYFTAFFPYIILTILLVRGCMLKGSLMGILYYVTPKFDRLMDPRVWVDAATQIFFSLGCCSGSLIAMSSFNPFKNNCCRDAIIVACINCATSMYAGLVVFANLGFMASVKNTTMELVAKSGPGLTFVVYPEALAQMPFPAVWSVCFFIMLTTLGLGSQFAIVETVMSGLEDELRRIGMLTSNWIKFGFRIGLCVVNFLLGIPMVCAGGYYLLFLVDWAMSGYPLMFICFTEITIICYSYGLKQFRKDIELMINARPNWYWRISWLVITPGVSVGLVIFSMATNTEMTLGDNYTFPRWAQIIAYLTAACPICCIPAWFLYKYCKEGGWILFKEFLKPVNEWGPAQHEHRAEFISMIRSNDSLRRGGGPGSSQVCLSSAYIPPGIGDPEADPRHVGDGVMGAGISESRRRLGGSTLLGSMAAIDTEGGFFQSKLSVAEKLTMAHNKEMAKKSGVDLAQLDTDSLTASQMALAAMTAVKEVQPYSVAYDADNASHKSSTDLAPTINFKHTSNGGPAIVPPPTASSTGSPDADTTLSEPMVDAESTITAGSIAAQLVLNATTDTKKGE